MIKVENLSKKYRIYHEAQNQYGTLVETLSNKVKSFFFKKTSFSDSYEEVFALKNLDFTIDEGDKVGIVGKNGAGKSSLLKILSRVITPTTGKVTIQKRISSLLEIGTGFHQELTGRENIYLNGVILGMSRKEIKKHFDNIVAFADVEKYLDTPVKRFSSGMHARLGFAIAAHLDPEILIVDEVLSVGDAEFQKKCLRKLGDIGSEGRTIIFVSHDIGSVLTLCNKGIYLKKGLLEGFGPIEECANAYMRDCRAHDFCWEGSFGDEHIKFEKAALYFGSEERQFIYRGENVRLEIDYEVLKPTPNMVLGIGVWNQCNQLLARSHTIDDVNLKDPFMQVGKQRAVFEIKSEQFHEGSYLLKLDCFIYNKKRILNDEVMLKFPIFVQEKNTHIKHVHNEGISLGTRWFIK